MTRHLPTPTPTPALDPTPGLPPTPSQTIGPFFGFALPHPAGGDVAPPNHPDAFTLYGTVLDGAGRPVPDAVVETWQAAPDGSLDGAPGSLPRNEVEGGHRGRNGIDFTGFGRSSTDAAGHWSVRTLPPPADRPYLAVCVFARGLTHHLFTRAYLVDPGPGDALLDGLDTARRETLITRPGVDGTHRFDIHLQGEKETVFLDFAQR
jgi:protocatechuate 3,4-dioxygenase, alpha subunit